MFSTRRKTSAAAVAVLAAALAAGSASPALGVTRPAAQCGPDASTGLPPLSPELLRDVLSGLPDDGATGALVQVRGRAGCWEGTGGVADLHTHRPVPQNGRFRIGSMTKTFTAVVALQLAAEGRLDLGQTVQHYLPGFLPADYPPITVRQVLTFTSGLNHVTVPNKEASWFLAHRYDHWAPGSQVDLGRPLAFAPGTRQRYGNVDYIVAGLLIEQVTGRSWAGEVTRRIIVPLGLHGTSVPGHDVTIRGPHAHGYEDNASGWVDVTNADMSLQWSAASIISNAPDLDRFLVALFSGHLLRGPMLEEMFTVPAVPTYDRDDDPANDQPAAYSAGLTRIPVGPYIVWAKSGDRPGYNNGMGATRDLARRLVYSVNTIHMGGNEQPMLSRRIVAAAIAGV